MATLGDKEQLQIF